MKTFNKIPLSCEMIDQELQDRDYAIMELWHTLQSCTDTKYNPVLQKYADFVQDTRAIYGDITYNKRVT